MEPPTVSRFLYHHYSEQKANINKSASGKLLFPVDVCSGFSCHLLAMPSSISAELRATPTAPVLVPKPAFHLPIGYLLTAAGCCHLRPSRKARRRVVEHHHKAVPRL